MAKVIAQLLAKAAKSGVGLAGKGLKAGAKGAVGLGKQSLERGAFGGSRVASE